MEDKEEWDECLPPNGGATESTLPFLMRSLNSDAVRIWSVESDAVFLRAGLPVAAP